MLPTIVFSFMFSLFVVVVCFRWNGGNHCAVPPAIDHRHMNNRAGCTLQKIYLGEASSGLRSL